MKITIKTQLIEQPKRRILQQVPFNRYTRERFDRVLGWVYADAVFGMRDECHTPVMLVRLIDCSVVWMKPMDAPQLHIRFESDNGGYWFDHWNGERIQHLYVP